MANNPSWGRHGLSWRHWNDMIYHYEINHYHYHQWRMLKTNLHYVWTFLNPYLLGETCLHDYPNAKKMLNHMLQKTINNPTTYPPTLKDFVENWGFFSNTPLVNDLNWLPSEWWIWLQLVNTHLHPSFIASWCECVPHHHVSGIRIHTHLFIAKCTSNWKWS